MTAVESDANDSTSPCLIFLIPKMRQEFKRITYEAFIRSALRVADPSKQQLMSAGLYSTPQPGSSLGVLTPGTQIVILLGNKVTAGVVSGNEGIRVGPSPAGLMSF